MVLIGNSLFNSKYLPPVLLHRDQELSMLTKFLPSESRGQALNILVHGSFGIGRTTLVRYFGKHEMGAYRRPFIRFQGKQPFEIVNDTLHSLYPGTTNSASLPEQWTLIKRLVRKSEVPILFTFDDVNSQTKLVYGKFLRMCKENGVSTMATAPKYYPRQIEAETSQNLELTLELEPFSDHQFLDIVRQRVTEIYSHPLSNHVTEFMADLICILDFQRPATLIELLQNLYPIIEDSSHITANQIRQACLRSRTLYYDFWNGHLSCLAKLDTMAVLLLQAIGQYFINSPGHIYVTKSNLFTQFLQVSEEIGLFSTSEQFCRALNTLLFHDLILRSRYASENFFTLLSAEGYLEIVDLLLGENKFDR